MMYDIGDLFDRREVVGLKLEDMLYKEGITKAKFCGEVGISRPTLDKLLSGNITNKANFVNHMGKVLRYLSMTPDELMGNIRNPYMQAKSLRNALRLKADDIQRATGISPQRLLEIESGGEATMAELRDIALCLETSVRAVLGESIFLPQIAALDDIIEVSGSGDAGYASGFWGHIGVLPAHSSEYLWYPITAGARSLVHRMRDKERMVVPCMNNKVLYLNMRNVNSIVLLDDACDSPDFANWDTGVDCGGTPQVVYESLEDYFYDADMGAKPDPKEFSPKFVKIMDHIIENEKWDEDRIHEIASTVSIHYTNGQVLETSIEFDDFETVSGEIEVLYNFEEYVEESKFLVYSDLNGAEIMINMDNVSVVELPLAKLEEAISRSYEEEMEE